MALDTSDILPFLKDFDILGARGCQTFPQRANLLVDVVETQLLEDKILLHCHQFFPEGYGIEAFHHDFINIPSDKFADNQLTILWDVRSSPPPRTFLWLLNVLDTDDMDIDFTFDYSSEWLFVNSNKKNPQVLRHLELFAGGFGGWKGATQVVTKFTQQRFQTVAIESSQAIASSYALTNGANLAKQQGRLPSDFLAHSSDDWVLVADVRSADWLPAICSWMPHFVSISATCQPWSGASKSPGLFSDDGLLFPYSLLLMRWIRPKIILLENVVGFATHPHKATVMKIFAWIGYKVVWQRSIDLIEQTLTHRVRWLCMAIRIHDFSGRFDFQNWNRFDSIPNIWVNDTFPDSHRVRLQVTDEILAIASNVGMHKSVTKRLSPKEVLELRIFSAEQKLPTFMARYGSQHEFASQYLLDFGYFGHFLRDKEFPFGIRFWHPCEIHLLHGCLLGCFVPRNIVEGWLIAGNVIAIPHAVLLVCNACNCIGTIAMHPADIMARFHHQKLCNSNCRIVEIKSGMFVVPIYSSLSSSFLSHAEQLFVLSESTEWKFWTPKLGCVSQMPLDNLRSPEYAEAASEASRVSISTLDEVLSPTLEFSPVVQGSLLLKDRAQPFWYDAALPADVLEAIWNFAFECSFQHDQLITAIMTPKIQDRVAQRTIGTIFLILENKLTIVEVLNDTTVLQQPKLAGLHGKLYDQFGELLKHHIVVFSQLVTYGLIQHASATVDALYIVAASRLCQTRSHWNFPDGSFFLDFEGDPVAQQVLLEFWSGALTLSSIELLGFTVSRELDIPIVRAAFRPLPMSIQCPPQAFELALFVAGIRSIFDSLAASHKGTSELISIVL